MTDTLGLAYTFNVARTYVSVGDKLPAYEKKYIKIPFFTIIKRVIIKNVFDINTIMYFNF